MYHKLSYQVDVMYPTILQHKCHIIEDATNSTGVPQKIDEYFITLSPMLEPSIAHEEVLVNG